MAAWDRYATTSSPDRQIGRRLGILLGQGVVIAAAFLIPNVLFVFLQTDKEWQLSSTWKLVATFALTMFKVSCVTLVIPEVSSRMIDMFSPVAFGDHLRWSFEVRLKVATALAVWASVLAPIGTMAIVDPRCWREAIWSPEDRTTYIKTRYCHSYNQYGDTVTCSGYDEDEDKSTYAKQFTYSGEQCASAIYDTYAPVHTASLIICSFGTAAVELLVPRVHSWLSQYTVYWVVRRARGFLECAFNESAMHLLRGEWRLGHGDFDGRRANAAQYLVERAFRYLIGVLVVALTFGLAVPLVGMAAAVSACCIYLHHAFLLGKLAVHFPRDPSQASPPSLGGCCEAPQSIGVFIVLVALGVWAGGAYEQFRDSGRSALAIGFWLGLVPVGVVLAGQRSAAARAAVARERQYNVLVGDSARAIVLTHHAKKLMERHGHHANEYHHGHEHKHTHEHKHKHARASEAEDSIGDAITTPKGLLLSAEEEEKEDRGCQLQGDQSRN